MDQRGGAQRDQDGRRLTAGQHDQGPPGDPPGQGHDRGGLAPDRLGEILRGPVLSPAGDDVPDAAGQFVGRCGELLAGREHLALPPDQGPQEQREQQECDEHRAQHEQDEDRRQAHRPGGHSQHHEPEAAQGGQQPGYVVTHDLHLAGEAAHGGCVRSGRSGGGAVQRAPGHRAQQGVPQGLRDEGQPGEQLPDPDGANGRAGRERSQPADADQRPVGQEALVDRERHQPAGRVAGDRLNERPGRHPDDRPAPATQTLAEQGRTRPLGHGRLPARAAARVAAGAPGSAG